MANLILHREVSAEEKLRIMGEAARFDIADGDDLAAGCGGGVPSVSTSPKVPKLFLSNHCIFNCAYCGCRSSRDTPRYVHTPGEMAKIAVAEGLRNRTGIFITSAVYRSPDYTQELIIETLRRIRRDHGYTGYVHAKIMPGADPRLIEEAGFLADRLSINIELPKSEGYPLIARQKNKTNILGPMACISEHIRESEQGRGERARRAFAPSGHTTQIVVGAMGESDRTLITLAEALYKKYELRRVYYSPFYPVQPYEYLPSVPTPRWRARRLYQADRLIQQYGFAARDLATEEQPDFQADLDPKAAWALRNIHLFPVEVNTADYETLVRVPGIGVLSTRRILRERRQRRLSHDTLIKMGISLKRARYFITCGGRYMGGCLLDHPSLRDALTDGNGQLSFLDQIV